MKAIILLALLICPWSIVSVSGDPLTISQNDGVLTHRIARGILEEIYAQIGVDVKFQVYPALRGLVMANNGDIDGDVARIRGIEKWYPNLVRVPTPIIHISAYAFGLNPDIEISSWSDLKGYRVGYIYGIKFMEEATKDLERERFYNFETMFRVLVHGRIDVAIATELQGHHMNSEYFPAQTFHILGEPLYEGPLYHVLNVRHQDLAVRIDEQLRLMRESGRYEVLYNNIYHDLFQGGM